MTAVRVRSTREGSILHNVISVASASRRMGALCKWKTEVRIALNEDYEQDWRTIYSSEASQAPDPRWRGPGRSSPVSARQPLANRLPTVLRPCASTRERKYPFAQRGKAKESTSLKVCEKKSVRSGSS